ncbi:MAG: EAL domain-containing protein [Proteobacteria bacterium]|nr:EAL domain-containing protein [Pseudomonadota bacterium]MDE3207289.1 EAL domain-containing protein [Pseudomonadota bacterium]
MMVDAPTNIRSDWHLSLFAAHPLPMWVYDLQTLAFLDVNQAALLQYGYTRQKFLSMSLTEIESPVCLPGGRDDLVSSVPIAQGNIYRHQKSNGTFIYANAVITPILFRDRRAAIALIQDVTSQVETILALAESNQRYKSLFEHNSDAVFSFDLSGIFLSANKACTQTSGYTEAELLEMSFLSLVVNQHKDRARRHYQLAARGRPQNFEIAIRHKLGHQVELNVINLPIVVQGQIVGVYGIAKDMTENKKTEKRLAWLAQYDPLTGLPNRNLFMDRLSQAINRTNRHAQSVALLFLDIDNFKQINDTLGHAEGDAAIRHMAGLLMSCVRETDTVARLGGDEFTVIMENVREKERIADAAGDILAALSQPFKLNAYEVVLSASVGITFYPEDALDNEGMLKTADIAMYHAKAQGRNNFQFYSSDLNVQAEKRMSLESELRRAIQREELVLFYQPQIDLRQNRVMGFEALLRWKPVQGEMRFPDQFVRLAEDTGLIVSIGEWVIETACSQMKALQKQYGQSFQVAVNLSARQFRHKKLLASIRQILERTGLEASSLDVEITESFLMDDIEHTGSVLHDLKQMGVSISIDDFGTGYSSLSYLKQFPIETLKIDQSFIRDVSVDPNDAAITSAIIAMGHSLNLKVIAEGVETSDHLEFLRKQGCDLAQGFFFSPALEYADLKGWIDQFRI